MNKKKNFLQRLWQTLKDTFATSVVHGEANGEGFLDDDTSNNSSDDVDDGGCECEE